MLETSHRKPGGVLGGVLGEFNPDTETFPAYLERAHIFLAANSIEEGKQVPVFLNAIGRTVYGM